MKNPSSRLFIFFILGSMLLFISCSDFASEELLQETYDGGIGTTYKLYRGNGGATTAYWYIVTIKPDNGKEKKIFHSYAEPSIKNISYNNESLILYDDEDKIIQISKNDFKKYVKKPLKYYRNEICR